MPEFFMMMPCTVSTCASMGFCLLNVTSIRSARFKIKGREPTEGGHTLSPFARGYDGTDDLSYPENGAKFLEEMVSSLSMV
jgi:hypothetical protein